MLYALTLWRPWPWCILGLPEGEAKRLENRDWAPPQSAVGQYIAIHAGLTWDEEGVNGLRSLGVEVPPKDVHRGGAIVGVARLAGYTVGSQESRWRAEGARYAWLLDNVRAIEPVECQGAPKLWVPPQAVVTKVRQAWDAAGRKAPSGTVAPGEDGATPGERLLATRQEEWEESMRILMAEGGLERDAAGWRALAHLLMELEGMDQREAELEAVGALARRHMRAVDEQVKAARAAGGVQ